MRDAPLLLAARRSKRWIPLCRLQITTHNHDDRLPLAISATMVHFWNLKLPQRYQEHIPKRTPLHYASALILLSILLFNSVLWRGTTRQKLSSHCVNLEIAVEATTSSMKHAASQNYPKGFCQRLPLHQSASWVWNSGAQQILEATFDPDVDSSPKWMIDAFRLLQPMGSSTRGRPQHEIWGHFLNKIELKLSEADLMEESDQVKVLILTSTINDVASCTMKGQSTPSGIDCAWPTRLQNILDTLLGEDVVKVIVHSLKHSSTSLVTHAIRTNEVDAQSADLIIYAMASQELYLDAILAENDLDRPIDLDARMTYYQRLLLRIQDFVRAASESQPCQEQQPPVLIVDEYVGNIHDNLLLEYSMTRALQQVADHYRIGYISYPHLVRKLVLTDTTASPWTPDWSKDKNIQHGKLGHLAIVWALLYNVLEYTIDYCSHESDMVEYRAVQMKTKLVEDWVFDLVQRPLPYLDGSLMWTNVNARWKESAINWQARKNHVCAGREHQSKSRKCSLAVWEHGLGDETMTAAATRSLLRPYLQGMTGFTILDGGIIRATQPNAHLELIIPNERIDVDQVVIYLGAGDLQTLKDPRNQLDSAELKCSIVAGYSNVTTVSATMNILDRTSLKQDIPDASFLVGQATRLVLDLVAGATVDIIGLFLCTSDEVA